MIQVLDKPLLNGVTPGNEHDGDRGGRGFGRQASRRPGCSNQIDLVAYQIGSQSG